MEKSKLIIKDITFDGFERIIECIDPSTQLHAIIAIHDTRLGPALGGIRAFAYPTFDAALTDVTRLAKGMSYKAAVAKSGTGGGKSVIILSPGQQVTTPMLHSLAEIVNSLQGHYISAEDLGLTQDHLSEIAEKTRYIVGFAKTSGNPSRFTAWGGLKGIQAVCQFLWGSPSLVGKKVAIQGLGAAGMRLAQFLFWQGAELIVSDINPDKVREAVRDLAATAVTAEEILSVECDILAPCALGGILTEGTIANLRCKAIAGLANNQLLTAEDGQRLHDAGILYAPDYVINAGGLINVCQEIMQEGYNAHAARLEIDQLYSVLLNIFSLSDQKDKPTSLVAAEIAEYHLEMGIGKREHSPIFHQ